MGQAFSGSTVVVGGGTTAPPYLHTHALRRSLPTLVAPQWAPRDDRDWLNTPSPLRAEIEIGSTAPPSLASLMGMGDRTRSASSLHRRVAMTRRFTQLQAQLHTGTLATSPTQPAATATATNSANSSLTAKSLAPSTISSSGSDYTECNDDGYPPGFEARIPPLQSPTPSGSGVRLSQGSRTPQLPPTPRSTPGSKIPVLSPAATSSARKRADLKASEESSAPVEVRSQRVQTLREGLRHDEWETHAVRAQLAGLPVGTAPAAIAHSAQAGLCYRCVSWRVPIRSTADHFSFRRGWLRKGETLAVVETSDHPTRGRSLRYSRGWVSTVDSKGKPLLKLVDSQGTAVDRSIAGSSEETSTTKDSSSSKTSLRGSISNIANIAAQSTKVAGFARKSISLTQGSCEENLRGRRSGQIEGEDQSQEDKENTPKFIVERRASVATALESLIG